MRVISGKYKGKKLKYNIKGTRPTMDRIKESMFALIQNYVKDSIVLDLFSGSGSLGIEALSNGSSKCYFIDNNKEAIKIINENLKSIDNSIVINDDYLHFIKNITEKFDIIFLDPPYHDNIIEEAINNIIKYNILNEDGIIVCEVEQDFKFDLKVIKEKKYGNKKIKVLKKIS